MSGASRTVARVLGLPRALADRVDLCRDLAVRMRDGTILRADHYAPRLAAAPTVLVRTPYGRGGPLRPLARAVAACGFHVVVQSCRGTFDSGGTFEPMLHERDDGLDTLDWLRCQPWYTGVLATYGSSYAGYTQWAIAADAGAELRAVAAPVTASAFADATYAGGAFSLDTVLTWSAILAAQRAPLARTALDLVRGQPRLRRGLAHPALAEADTVAVGAVVPHYQRWLVENATDAPYWLARGHDRRLSDVDAAVLMVGGRYDIFLPWQLRDYAALRAAGKRPYLVVGPWHHGSPALFRVSTRESVRWLRAQLYGERELLPTAPVRVHVGGVDRWRELADWPPPARTVDWWLRPGGGLGTAGPGGGPPDRFRYDPARPTPAVGGPRLAGRLAGRVDNRALERRGDVLVYSSQPLAGDVEVIGPVRATIRMRSSTPYFDVFVRLCDVTPAGGSYNVCDGLVRVAPGRFDRDAEGALPVAVDLWPTAYRFRAGHRIRVQVSGGAHPRFSRNPGTGAPLAAAGTLRVSQREVCAGSALHLPIVC